MTAKRAGAMAAGIVHQGLVKGATNQPRPSHVGLNSLGIINFGVLTPAHTSSPVSEQIVIKTPKSLMTTRT